MPAESNEGGADVASIDKRPDGTYRARWREYPGSPQRTKHFKLKRDAEDFLVSVQHDLARGRYVPPEAAKTGWATYVEVFLARQVWRERTRSSGTRAITRATAVWGDRPLASIRRTDVQSYVAQLDLAPTSIAMELKHVGSVFKAAIDDGLIARNPRAGVRVPKATKGKVDPLTVEQVHALHAAAPDWFKIAVVLGAGTGARQSEVRGLTLDRVRFLERAIRIDRQAHLHAEGWGPTKSKNGVRTVPSDAPVLDAISAHVQSFGAGPAGLVLHRDGAFVNASSFTHFWGKTRDAAGMPDVRFHDLRHAFVSELLGDGVSVVAVADIAGDRPATILETYGHLVTSDHDRVRATLRRLWKAAEDSLRTVDTPSTL